MKSSNRALKAVSSLGFIFLTVAISLIFLDGPATGYEASIYEALPVLVWIFMCGSVAIGFGIGVHQALSNPSKHSQWWIVGLLIILGNNLVFLLLPVLRGYVLYGREDAMTHVGYSVDIINSGFLPDADVYPLQHALVAVLSEMTGLSTWIITGFLPSLLSIAYVFFTFNLSRLILVDQRLVRMATISSTVLLFSPMQYHSWLSPIGIGVLITPLIVYAFLRSCSTQSTLGFKLVTVLLVGMALPFLHPLSWLVMSASLLGIGLVLALLRYRKTFLRSIQEVLLGPVGISAVVFATWFLSFYVAEHMIRLTFERFFGAGIDFNMMERVLRSADKVGYGWVDVLLLAGKMFTHNLIFISLTIVAIIIAANRVFRGKGRQTEFNILLLLPAIICPLLFFFLHLFVTIVDFGIYRLVTFIVVLTPLPVAYVLTRLYELSRIDNSWKASILTNGRSKLVIYSFLFVSWMSGFTGTYGWSFIKQPNQQVTHMEISGVQWLVQHKAPSVSADMNRMVWRFTDGIFGTEWRAEQGIYRAANTTSPIGSLPDHFGYFETDQLGGLYDQDLYIPLSTYDIAFHTQSFPEFDQFSEGDFVSLHFDESASKIFSNGGFETWYIRSVLGE